MTPARRGPTVEVPCNAPAGAPDGYILSASDGGVFNYGNIPFCGSTGSIHLNRPVVASALTRDGVATGRWRLTAASSPSAMRTSTAPWVEAAQPAHRRHGGHPGRRRLLARCLRRRHLQLRRRQILRQHREHPSQPAIVGMALTPSGNGYWLVASDGGIFSYGDAKFAGSMGGAR